LVTKNKIDQIKSWKLNDTSFKEIFDEHQKLLEEEFIGEKEKFVLDSLKDLSKANKFSVLKSLFLLSICKTANKENFNLEFVLNSMKEFSKTTDSISLGTLPNEWKKVSKWDYLMNNFDMEVLIESFKDSISVVVFIDKNNELSINIDVESKDYPSVEEFFKERKPIGILETSFGENYQTLNEFYPIYLSGLILNDFDYLAKEISLMLDRYI
jgi:hypothetical protein